jgi:hypothetical protein
MLSGATCGSVGVLDYQERWWPHLVEQFFLTWSNTRSQGLNYARSANCNGKAQKILSSSFPSEGRRLRQLALQGCWSVRRKKPSSKSKSIHTCPGMLAASSWQTMAPIRVPSRHTLDTRIFSTLCGPLTNAVQRFLEGLAHRQLRGAAHIGDELLALHRYSCDR